MKRFIRRTLKHFGLEIQRIETIRTLMGFITDRNIDVVLDVGANVGQFGASLRAQGYRGKIVSYEPISTVYRTLAVNTATDLEWDINNFALGLKAESVTINVSGHPNSARSCPQLALQLNIMTRPPSSAARN